MGKNKIIIIVGSSVLLLSLALYFFAYKPLIKKINLAHQEYSGIEEKINLSKEALAALQELQIKKDPINEKNLKEVSAEIVSLAKQNGLVVIATNIAAAERQEAGFKIVPLEMETESNYKALGVFLGQLEGLPFGPVELKDFLAGNNQGAASRLKSRLTLNLYLAESQNAR